MLKSDIAMLVKKCLTCQMVKAEHQKPAGKLRHLEIPEWNWNCVTMDFVTRLPRSQEGHDAIWVIVDQLTTTAHFIAIRTNYKVPKLCKLYNDRIIKLHGIPVSVVSNRDARFTSKF